MAAIGRDVIGRTGRGERRIVVTTGRRGRGETRRLLIGDVMVRMMAIKSIMAGIAGIRGTENPEETARGTAPDAGMSEKGTEAESGGEAATGRSVSTHHAKNGVTETLMTGTQEIERTGVGHLDRNLIPIRSYEDNANISATNPTPCPTSLPFPRCARCDAVQAPVNQTKTPQ